MSPVAQDRVRLIRILSIVVAALPFAFALIRAAQPRHDLRFLWLALATGATAWAADALIARYPEVARRRVTRAVAALVAATIVGGLVGGAMTRLNSGGAWATAFFFACCFAFAIGVGAATPLPQR